MSDLAPFVEADTSSPDEAVPTGTSGGRGWRRRAWLVGSVVLVVVLALAWAGAPGLLVRMAPASLQFPEDAPAVPVDGFSGPDGAYVVGYEHDTYLDVDVLLHNAGPVGVDVTAVRLELQSAPLLVPTDASAPGTVPAGQGGVAGLQLRFDNCEAYHEREAMVVEALAVEARVLGRTVVERVPLDRPLMARSPMLWQCPDRTLDRDDDRRPSDEVIR